MKKISLKLLAMTLIAAMLCSMFPVMAMGAQPEAAPQEISKKSEAIIEADIWSKIDRFEDENIIATRDDLVSVEDYAELSDEIEALVKQSETYVEGTINRNGDFFTWETSEGIVCGYSPELRFKTRNLSEIGQNEIEVKSFATKAAPGDKDVYLIAPYYGYDNSFTDQYKNEAQSIAKATGGQYTLYQGTNATITNIATAMQNGGVVIFDSHGITDYSSGDDYVSRANSSYLCLKSSTGITSTDMKAVSGTYGTYYHAFDGGSAYCVDGTAIKNHMTKAAPGTILWMAICLGMATNGLCTPMRNAGVEVVYGYSQSVSFTGDYKYETYFWNKMKSGSDVKTAISYMKSQSGSNWDPAYGSYSLSQAQRNYVAFPIVVSDQDTYPGQGKVDAVQTVYSTYKLIDNSGSGGSTQPTTAPTTDPDEGGTVETYTYNLVTSASSLTAGEYIIVAAANGTYAGDYSYYALTTTKDSNYSTMQSSGLGFTSLPSAVTCDTGSIPYFAFTLSGNANGFTLKSNNGSLEGGGDSEGVYLYYNTASTWTATYNSSSKGFQLKTGGVYMALRDDISTMGANGTPMFATATSSGTTVMHMYKRENAGTCSHTDTSTTTTPATCTTPGSNVVTCNACGTVVTTTSIPATGHNISYTANNDGTHDLYCSNCNGTGEAACTYNNNVCIYCGYVNSSSGSTDTNSDRYELVTSASDLTSGQYLIMASASGTYAGDYGYYVLTTTVDGSYKAMQSLGLNFDSMPSALLLDVSATSKYVWTLTGNANSFTAKANGGYLTAVSGSTSLMTETSSSAWKGTYSSSKYGFALTSNSRYLALRDDIETVGDNSLCLFTTVASGSGNVYMHLYKKVGDTAACTHSNTTTNTTPATCTAAGEAVEICDDCGETVSTTAIPATGHTSKTTTTPATCTTAGKTVETCTTCGVTIKTTTIPATGHSTTTTTTPATCLVAGKTVESCTLCGVTIKTTTIPATGHSIKTTTTPATCTTDGKTVETCTTCGATVSTVAIPATGHSTKTTTVAPTCTASGKTTEVCTVCGVTVKTTTTAALGHDPAYTSNNDGTHVIGCSRCDRKETADCELTDNACDLCGYTVQIEQETLNVKINHSLNLVSDISINYAVAASQLAGFDSFYLECKIPTYENNKQTGTTTVILEPVLTGSYYYFTMDGLTAVQINDTLVSVLHASKDGEEKDYVSAPDSYSVATYAYNQFNKTNASEELKTLCAELLRYGAKAQIYKNHRTNALADDALTPEQNGLLSDLTGVTFGQNNRTLDDLSDPSVTWAGKSLSLDAKITLRMIFDLSNYDGDVQDLSVRVTYTNLEGEEVTTIVTGGTVYSAARNFYAFNFSDLRIAELRTVLSAAAYEGDVQVSPTVEYSMDSYGAGRTGNLLSLCRALVAYADAARTYFLK